MPISVLVRVSGLDSIHSKENLKTLLKNVVSSNLSDDEKKTLRFEIDIVPSCWNKEQMVALIDFRERLPYFSRRFI
jgi:hypothetical protein